MGSTGFAGPSLSFALRIINISRRQSLHQGALTQVDTVSQVYSKPSR